MQQWLIVGLCVIALGMSSSAGQAAPPTFDDGRQRPVSRRFALQEWLEHPYTDELVGFPVSFKLGECLRDSLRLVDDNSGEEIAFQVADSELYEEDGSLRSATVWFWVDSLPALGKRSYTLYGAASAGCRPPAWDASAVTWTALDADIVEVNNGVFSLRLAGNRTFDEPKRPSEVRGPLRGFKGVDGEWRATSQWQVESKVLRHSLRVAEHGPLWTTFASRFEFVSPPGTGGTDTGPFYEMRIKVFPGRDFCRVRERSNFPLRLEPMPRDVTGIPEDPNDTDNWRTMPCPADNLLINCEKGWKADRLYAATVFSRKYVNHPLRPDQFRIHTAIRPALPFMDAGWFATYSTKGQDLLGLVGVDARLWQYPDNCVHPTAGTPGRNTDIMFVNEPGRGAYFRLPLARMERHWLLVVTTRKKVVRDPQWVQSQKKKAYLRHFADRIEPQTCYLWQLRYKFGDLPLNKVKDWILDYDEPREDHPYLFPEARDRQAVLKNIESLPGLAAHFKRMYNSSPYMQYLKTGTFEVKGEFDPGSGIGCVKEQLSQGYNAYIYVLSMGQYVPWMIQFCDIVAPGISDEDWKRMCRYALAGTYVLADDDYWQYAYVRNETTYLPNFNTCRWFGVGIAGLFFRNHPESKKWIEFSRYYLEKELDYHITVDGVGEENVGNYYPFAWRMMSTLIRIMQEKGIADYRNDPKYLAGTRFWLDVLTPPDVRFDPPRRMIPPIGNHPYSAPGFGLHEWNANTFQQIQPDLAAWSHWAWLECGQQPAFHHLLPLNFLWANADFKAKVPPLHSKPLKGFGYIFRNHFPSEKETYLSFKAGRVYFHHDGDEGSFHMFAKGVPLACDGLELIGYTKANVHNMVEILDPGADPKDPKTRSSARGGEVVAHFESPQVDWAAGFFAKEKTRKAEFVKKRIHHTDWRRDIMLIKSKDPEGAEYFAVYDYLNGPDPAIWNLDVHSEEPVVEPATDASAATVRYPGIRKPEYDVGLDVIFVSPASPAIEKVKGTINQAQRYKFPVVEHWLIHSPRRPSEDTFTVLFPRRAGQPAPKVSPILGGRGCVVEHQEGRDIIFASPVPVTYSQGGIEFCGRFGVVRDRQGDRSLTLLDGVLMSYKGRVLKARGNVGF